MRDMNPRSACRRTPTLMEIHMTTYKPTGEKPDEFNLYLQERMAALGLDPKTIAENTGIALPTVLTHLNLPGKPIKPQSIQKFAAELNVPYAVLRDLYTRVRCQGKVRTKYVIGMMPKGETALLAMMIKNTLTYRSIPMTDFSEMTGIPLDQLMYPPRKPSDAFVAALAQGFDVGEDAIREHATSLVGTKDRTPIVLSELQKRGLCFRDWIAMTNCSVENAYRLLVGRFPLDPDLKITAALALRIDPEEFIFRYDTSKSTTASEAKRAKRFCELVIAMMEHKKLTKSEFIHKSGVHSFTADTMLAGETTPLQNAGKDLGGPGDPHRNDHRSYFGTQARHLTSPRRHPSAVTTGSRETNPSGLGPAAALGVVISGGILFKDRTVWIRYFAVIAHAAHFR